MTKRVGPKMELVAAYVSAHPGCPKLAAAEHVMPHRSRMYGYRTVDRAIRAGLVRAIPAHASRYELYPCGAITAR